MKMRPLRNGEYGQFAALLLGRWQRQARKQKAADERLFYQLYPLFLAFLTLDPDARWLKKESAACMLSCGFTTAKLALDRALDLGWLQRTRDAHYPLMYRISPSESIMQRVRYELTTEMNELSRLLQFVAQGETA